MDAATGATGSADAPLLLLAVAVSTLAFLNTIQCRRRVPRGAPSPPSLPLLGHLHLLPGLPRRRAPSYDEHGSPSPVCASRRTSRAAGRPRLLAGDVLGYGCSDIVWASYGDHWRTLRRFFSAELLSAPCLAARAADRRAEVAALVDSLLRDASGATSTMVTLRPRLFEFVINVMLRALISASLHGSDVRRWQEIVEESVRLNASPSVGDLYPALRWVDQLRGVEAALARLQARREALLVGLIEDHRRKRDAGGGVRDTDTGDKVALDELLTLQERDPSYYTDTLIKGIVMAILQGGTRTSMLTIEWAMAQLLLHPEAMNKVRTEIHSQIGAPRLVEESDIASLPYLQCVIKETLRLRPVGPIIPAHEAMEDCTLGGFHIQHGTMILVNAWALQQDPAAWDAPEKFLEDGGGKVMAAAIPMLPFGIGRRRCPAETMAVHLVTSTVAALVQCFEWDVGEGRTIDMTEGGGLSMPMATPLAVHCKPHGIVKSMLSAST